MTKEVTKRYDAKRDSLEAVSRASRLSFQRHPGEPQWERVVNEFLR